MVTAQYLLEGAIYALEQCGLLLRDSVTLYRQGSYANAIVLAAFAREELGRYDILRELRGKLVEGGSVLLEDVNKKCRNHELKQERAQLSVNLQESKDMRLDQIIRSMFDHHLQSNEYRQAEAELNQIVEQIAKDAPHDRHALRMKSLYVEPDQSSSGWNRPKEQSRESAFLFLQNAANDYSAQYNQILLGNAPPSRKELITALQAWSGRPELPPPIWPD
jgi:AbiV family abortive infection protein